MCPACFSPVGPFSVPPFGLLPGLVITLSAVLAYSAYMTWQIRGLRKLQTDLVDRNRKDSLQLLRIQNDLNLLAVAMRDMVSSNEPYPLTAWCRCSSIVSAPTWTTRCAWKPASPAPEYSRAERVPDQFL